ncbi:ParB N-terminal domain-containing protein [Streptomyces sp. SID14478]|uniref:ParB/RepB/Spo0J family partition protein n=1 Tax=Streptomyces sp. SID14478 TaxID=2706073 RepID=UPI0013DCCEAF|nr:ParB N-terminal domain-containing protein [Streptomyces sp. SID14478]NEB76002.1 ParB N-terminal domain-containing protein [Streptomyces sp. SID14478]
MSTATTHPTAGQIDHQAPQQPEYLDASLIVRDEQNARESDTAPDEQLITSVKAVGVQDAISVRPLPDGTYAAFKGWRRAQAAQLANATAAHDARPLRRVPAYVRADLVGRDPWTRFLSLIENDHRKDMDPRDRLKSAELALLGMDDVERATATTALGLGRGAAKRVKQAQKLTDAELRRASAGGMDLEQTAQLAEVAQIPQAERRLLAALGRDTAEGLGGRGHWDQELALLTAESAEQDKRATAEMALKEAGIVLLRPGSSYQYREDKDAPRPLSELCTTLGNTVTEQMHRTCPGHSARLDHDSEPVWHCAQPVKHGHKVRPEAKKPKQPLSDADRAQRANTVARNRAWKAARGPRQAFATTLARSGKPLPESARTFAQRALVAMPYFYAQFTEKCSAMDIAPYLGLKAATHSEALELIAALPKNRTLHVMFAQVAAAYEYSLREPKAWQALPAAKAAWLLLLEELGRAAGGSYALSEVEADSVAAHRPADPKPPNASKK